MEKNVEQKDCAGDGKENTAAKWANGRRLGRRRAFHAVLNMEKNLWLASFARATVFSTYAVVCSSRNPARNRASSTKPSWT